MQGETGGGHLSAAGRNVTFLDQSAPEWNSCIMLLRNRLIRAIWFAETLRRPFFIFSLPGLTSSSRPYRNFSKGESFSNKFSHNSPLKQLCQHFFTRLLHRPGPLHAGWEYCKQIECEGGGVRVTSVNMETKETKRKWEGMCKRGNER